MDNSSTKFCEDDIIVMTFSPLIIIMNLGVLISSKLLLCTSYSGVGHFEEGRKISLILLGNLSLADLAMCVIYTYRQLTAQQHMSYTSCIAEKGAIVGCCLASMSCIFLIALDRYFFIVHSIRYDHYMTEYRARILIYLSWILAILFGLLPITVKAYYKAEQGLHCRFVTPENIDIMLIAAGLAFPLIIGTFLLYMAIYLKARRVSKTGLQKPGCQRLKTRSVIVVFLSSSCFLLTWGPYLITLLIYGSFCGGNGRRYKWNMCFTLEQLMVSPFPMMGFFNSLLNPIIFAWWHRPFTKALYEIFCPGKARKSAQARFADRPISTIESNA